VNNDIDGLISSVNDGSTSAFMWEWFTTKPFADAGKVRFIGSVPTPWPSWLIAAHPSPERAPEEAVRRFLADLTAYVRQFDSEENRAVKDIDFIKEKFGYPEEDIKAWLRTVGYTNDCTAMPTNVIQDTLRVLEKAGVVKTPTDEFNVEKFVDIRVARMT